MDRRVRKRSGIRGCYRLKEENVRLLTESQVWPHGAAQAGIFVCRGMAVNSREGAVMGRVAAVAVEGERAEPLCLILGHLPEGSGYQSIPVSWVEREEAGQVYLKASAEDIQALPDWHTE